MGGDEAMVRRFLELFKTEMPKQLADLEDQLKIGDLAAANVTAHGIKGQLRTLGLEGLAEMARLIEEKTEPGNENPELEDILEGLSSAIGSLLS